MRKAVLLIRVITVMVFAMFCFSPLVGNATPAPNSSTAQMTQTYSSFYTKTATAIKNIATAGTISTFAWNLYKTFAITLALLMVIEFAFRGVNLASIVYNMLLIFIVSAMMTNYPYILDAFWEWSDDFAKALQMAAMPGNSGDPMGIANAIFSIVSTISLQTVLSLNPVGTIAAAVAIVIVELVAILLAVLAAFASMWSLWGFSLANMIGLMCIPFLLFERLSWIFDGWFRFMFGFLIYGVIARANLLLVLIVLTSYLGLPLSTNVPANVYTFSIDSMMDCIGLLVFLLIGVLALFNTGVFAATIVSGAAGGGIGAAMRNAARIVSQTTASSKFVMSK